MKYLIAISALLLSGCSSNADKDASTLAFCIEHKGIYSQSTYSGNARRKVDFGLDRGEL